MKLNSISQKIFWKIPNLAGIESSLPSHEHPLCRVAVQKEFFFFLCNINITVNTSKCYTSSYVQYSTLVQYRKAAVQYSGRENKLIYSMLSSFSSGLSFLSQLFLSLQVSKRLVGRYAGFPFYPRFSLQPIGKQKTLKDICRVSFFPVPFKAFPQPIGKQKRKYSQGYKQGFLSIPAFPQPIGKQKTLRDICRVSFLSQIFLIAYR